VTNPLALVIASRATVTLGGRFNIRTVDDLDSLALVADEYRCSIACLIAMANGDGEPLGLGEEE